jgi:hypothetical protein
MIVNVLLHPPRFYRLDRVEAGGSQISWEFPLKNLSRAKISLRGFSLDTNLLSTSSTQEA